MSPAFRLSLGLNLALAAVVAVLLARERPAAAPREPSAPPAGAVAGSTPRSDQSAPASPARPTVAALTPAAVADLERMGIARSTLANVILEDLNRRTTKHLVELQKRYAPRLVPNREMVEFARQCDADRISALKVALGEDGYRAWDKEQTLVELNRARVPGDELPLSDQESEQAYRLQKDFDDRARELQAMMEDGVADRADVGTLQAQAQQTLDRELAKLLGPKRFDELRGNTDPTTQVYRNFGDLNPTPDQANAVVQADAAFRDQQAALAKKLNDNPAGAANVIAELKAMDDAHDESMRQIFGAAAYDKMKQQSDPTFQTLQQYAGAWSLSDQDVQSAYAALHALQEQTDRTRSAADMNQSAGQSVNWREINAGIEETRQQTEASLTALLGADRLHRLEQNGLLGK